MTAKATHTLTIVGPTSPLDPPAVVLALQSRGRRLLAGDDCRAERDELAALVGPGPLATLLAGGDPIRVSDCPAGYVIEAV